MRNERGFGSVARRSSAVIVGIALGVGLLAGCTSDEPRVAGSASSTSSAADVRPTPTADAERDPSEPTAAAEEAEAELRPTPDGVEACGVLAADSGWPTTTISVPAADGCLVTAAAEGRAAVQTFTGRTGDGGALLTRYEVDAAGTLTITRHVISATGEVTTSTDSCTPPVGTWSLGIEGGLAVWEVDGPVC